MAGLEIIDWIIVGIILVSVVVSFFRGFFREALSLATWALAIWVAWQFADLFVDYFAGLTDNPVFRLWIARSAVLVVVLMIGGIASWAVVKLLHMTGLTGTDRVLGMLFGLLRGVVVAALLVFLLEVSEFDQSPWWSDSKLIPYAAPVVAVLRELAADGMELLDDGGPRVPQEAVPAAVAESQSVQE